MHDYIHYYGGKAHMERRAAERAAEERTDVDVLRDHHKYVSHLTPPSLEPSCLHRFLWSEADSSEGWEKQLAKNYYDQLFKGESECCVALLFYLTLRICLSRRICTG